MLESERRRLERNQRVVLEQVSARRSVFFLDSHEHCLET